MTSHNSRDFLDLVSQPTPGGVDVSLSSDQVPQETGGIQEATKAQSSANQTACQSLADGQALASLLQNENHVRAVTFECLASGLHDSRVASLMRILEWPEHFQCFTIAGTATKSFARTQELLRTAVHDLGGSQLLCGIQGKIFVALIEIRNAVTPEVTCTAVLNAFIDNTPLCIGPTRSGLAGASASIRASLTSLQAAPAVYPLQRPMRADDVLPERALLGDEDAREELYSGVYASLLNDDNADDPTLSTVFTFLQSGGSLDTTARELNVHPNTVRYRLKRAAETTGWDATDPREAYVLLTAITLGRIKDATTTPDGRL